LAAEGEGVGAAVEEGRPRGPWPQPPRWRRSAALLWPTLAVRILRRWGRRCG
jgi:hypothetical protein